MMDQLGNLEIKITLPDDQLVYLKMHPDGADAILDRLVSGTS